MPATRPTLFATTRWTLIRDAAGDETGRALGELARIYWQPLYRYARRKGKSREDAEDLVQGFLAHLMRPEALRGTDPAKGKFRAFVLAAFNHWMIGEWKRGQRVKRGGGVLPLSLDWQDAETGLSLEVADERGPDRHFDREWALALLDKVLADVAGVFRAEGNAAQFEALKPCLTADSAGIPYAELAKKLGLTEGAARVAVHRLRKRYRHQLTAEIARTLSPPEAVDEEMRSLFAALAG
jgi:RNA polymerase sigma factor (sigma-70 family)